jgi:hypothetical protein
MGVARRSTIGAYAINGGGPVPERDRQLHPRKPVVCRVN